ncbi:hypothetical protein [Micromonospora endolithica]|uniref:Uncharacterized protein n=1 Tax=Micromonospora endolithica TaxID=230091 RepID=A0A3A9ZCW4_9ACTN|nr:hypothetical protein [Micromonospora endolithica]RKN46163.1 hypothetical protein D7223_14570 [Micromonospora endolithica]TWJ25130.1 hypothetical protein JD76_05293 [Micromonospora endolithica]
MPHRRDLPRNVSDVLLWLLAADVADAHPPHPERPGDCANLRCVGEAYPCPPARDARRAYQAATRCTLIARGRARVTAPAAALATRFAGWFRPTRPIQAPSPRSTPSPRAA